MSEFQNKNLRILFWNPRSIVHKKEELAQILTQLDICICVESWLTDEDKNFHFAGFKTFRKDRQHARGGGILILIRSNLAFFEINNLKRPDPTVDIAGLTITNLKFPLDLIVCYRTPNFILSQSQ